MEAILKDIRFAWRMLLKNPGFAAVATITLALGIGANSAIFSVIDGVLLKPLPYKDPGRLVRVFEHFPAYPMFPVSPADFLDYRERNRAFDGLAIYLEYDRELSARDRPERLPGMLVSGGFFRLLGVQPTLGRDLTVDDEQPGNGQVALISDRLWKDHFASDPNILGRTLKLDSLPVTIIGVLPPGFQHIGGTYRSGRQGQMVDIWSPFTFNKKDLPRGAHFLNAIARLAPRVTLKQAEAQMNSVAAGLATQYPDSNKESSIRLAFLTDEVVGPARTMLLVLLGASAFVLLIACVNVANLLLARTASRAKELAVRSALGAGRIRLIRQLLTEALLISLAGGVAGTLLAVAGIKALVAIGPRDLPRLHEVGLGWHVFGFTMGVSVLTAIVFGIAPAFRISKANVGELLKDSARGSSAGPRQHRLGKLLVVAEVSLALVLLVGATLLLRSFIRLQAADPGFKPYDVLTFRLALPPARYQKSSQAVSFYNGVLDRIRALPGVRFAGATSDLPWTGYDDNTSIEIEGHTHAPDDGPHARYHFVTTGAFEALGVPLLEGRCFGPDDRTDSAPVILINRAMASRYWPGGDPVGSKVDAWGRKSTVAGIVGDVKDAPQSAASEPAFYWPLPQVTQTEMYIAVRSSAEATSLVEPIRQQIRAIDPDLPMSDVRMLNDVAAAAVSTSRFTLLLVASFAGVALLLAGVGTYGVISYTVSQRGHDIGVRMALGATRTHIVNMVVGEGLLLLVLGLGIGLGSAFAVTRVMASLLYQISATDTATFAVASGALAAASMLACCLSAFKASRTDPMIALRTD